MKRKTVWNVIIWKAMGDVNFKVFVQKPDWDNIKPFINAKMIEIQKGYDKDISDRSFEMLCNEEAKMTNMIVRNNRATKAWYEWQKRTGRTCIPGDFIAGDVAILKKVTEPNEEVQSVVKVA